VLKRHNDQRLRQIERQRAAIEAEIETRIKAAPELARRFAILLSIPGIARVSAFTLLIEMPELGAMDAKQAASLAGLAPVARQSGRWTGRPVSRQRRCRLIAVDAPTENRAAAARADIPASIASTTRCRRSSP